MIKVLIVENDPMVVYLNRSYLLQMDGFSIAAATNSAKEALAVLDTQPVDLILLGVHLQESSGLELLAQIRARGMNVDVVMITAAKDTQTVSAALRYGVVDYLIKPFECERFLAMMASYKQRMQVLRDCGALSQDELDQSVFKMVAAVAAELPKGIDSCTLRSVWDCIRQFDGYFTTNEVAKAIGISRVSMRKYLEFLERADVLKLEISYGSVGRPVYKYRRISENLPI